MATSAPSQGRVLVVDDSPLAVEMLEHALTTENWEVATATDAGEALEMAARWRPDVVVSDLYMPGLDGLEFLRRLRAIDACIPLVMTSSEQNVAVVLRAVHAGVYDYVLKSGDSRVLAAAVARAAAHARTVRDNLRLGERLRQANAELESRVAERTRQLSDANQELQRLMGQLIATERLAAIGQLAAGIAHEINNPLSYVLSNLAYVRGRLAELEPQKSAEGGFGDVGEVQQALVEAEDGANRIAEIVRDVRTMSRTDDRSRGRFDINLAVRSATRIAGEQIRRHAALELDLEPNLEVVGSVGRMTQVLINLLVNAVDAICERPRRDHVICIKTSKRGERVLVCVRDTGNGIRPEAQARIFEPFYTTKPEGRGTGLGLSICRDIVEGHGGTIAVTSQLDEGTTITLELPPANSAFASRAQ